MSTEAAGSTDQVDKYSTPPQKTPLDIFFTYLKYIVSSGLTLTYVVYILWGIWTNQAVLPGPPIAHFLIFLFCMTLVAYLEGLQVAILAVEHTDPEKYRETHPRAYELITSVKRGNNVEKFLVGRQFFTVFVMTLMAQVTSFPNISSLGIPPVIWFIFIQTGLPGAMVVTTIGSLQPQLLAAKDPWKFMNLYGSCATLYLCYGLEFTGICTHFAWMLITILRNTVFITDQKPKKHQREVTLQSQLIEAAKYVVSTCVILTYMTYLMWGIWTGQAVLPVPHIAVFIVFCCCILFLAHLEGLQVAILVAEAKDPEPYAQSYPRAYSLMKRATYEKNVRRFLIGRQFFVIFVVFLINQCTIFPEISKLGINNGVWFVFVQLGFPTALNILCFAQLPAQLLGNQDPWLFMNRYGPRFTLEVCLFTEMTGLAHFSWVATSFSKATWFPITVSAISEIEQYKDLESIKTPNAATDEVTSAAPTSTVQDYNSVPEADLATEELDMEMHSNLGRFLKSFRLPTARN